MELLKKLLDFITNLLERFDNKKKEKEEIETVIIEQIEKTEEAVSKVKKNKVTVKPPKKDNFFND